MARLKARHVTGSVGLAPYVDRIPILISIATDDDSGLDGAVREALESPHVHSLNPNINSLHLLSSFNLRGQARHTPRDGCPSEEGRFLGGDELRNAVPGERATCAGNLCLVDAGDVLLAMFAGGLFGGLAGFMFSVQESAHRAGNDPNNRALLRHLKSPSGLSVESSRATWRRTLAAMPPRGLCLLLDSNELVKVADYVVLEDFLSAKLDGDEIGFGSFDAHRNLFAADFITRNLVSLHPQISFGALKHLMKTV